MNEDQIARLANKFCENEDVSAKDMELILEFITYIEEHGDKHKQHKAE